MATSSETNWKLYYIFSKKWVVQNDSPKKKLWLGTWLWLSTVVFTIIITWAVLHVAYLIHPLLGNVMFVYLSYTTLAARSLINEGNKVCDKLKNATIEAARRQVGMIVGRDTSTLSETEITNATIETIAENTSDGVVAPLLCLFIGGPVFAMAYKAVNTLDSMVGYKNDKYRDLGCVSAKMDDLWNLIPARLTWGIMLLSAFILKMNPANARKVAWRDRYNHKSPNSAFPESVAAGALGIRLGGTHIYYGMTVYKPYIGEALKPVEANDIQRMNRLLIVTASSALIIFSVISLLIQWL